jgi:hypothetical protein
VIKRHAPLHWPYAILLLSLLPIGLLGCAASGPKLSPMQIREMTTREIEGSYENVFRATLTVLQDNGYVVKNTDMDSGLIVATIDKATSGGNQFAQALFMGYVSDKGKEYEASCMVSELNKRRSEVRINIQETSYGQSSKWSGTSKQGAKQIYDPAIYKTLFDNILLEVKRREAINPSGEPAAASEVMPAVEAEEAPDEAPPADAGEQSDQMEEPADTTPDETTPEDSDETD